MRLIIPGQKPACPHEDDFRKLSIAFANYVRGSLLSDESANPLWPLDKNADAILRALWTRMTQLLPIPGIASFQPDQLSVEVTRHGNTLVVLMRFPRLRSCVCFSAGALLLGPIMNDSVESLKNASRRFIVLAEDVGAPGEAEMYDLTGEQAESIGMISAADPELFVATVVGRYVAGRTGICLLRGDEAVAKAIAEARGLVSYFVGILESYPAVNEYSVKVRFEDDHGSEYFWLENTRWQNGMFVGTIGNDPELTKCVAYGQAVSVTPDQVCDWYYMWEGKMRGNYTLRANLPFLHPDQAAKWSSILDQS